MGRETHTMSNPNGSSDIMSRLWPVLLAMLGSLSFLHQQPFQTAREASATVKGDLLIEKAGIPSRLWQDPFRIVGDPNDGSDAAPPLSKVSKVVGVMVTGSPGADGEEWRIRYRHAVVTGLHENG